MSRIDFETQVHAHTSILGSLARKPPPSASMMPPTQRCDWPP